MADGRRSWTCRRFPPAPLVSCDRVKLTRLQVLFMMIVLLTEMQTPMSSLHSILAISLLSLPPNSAVTARSPTTTCRCSPATTKSPSSSNLQVSLGHTGCRYLTLTSRICPSPPRRHAHRADARTFRPSSHSAPAATSRCRSCSQDDQGRWRVAARRCDCSLWHLRVRMRLCVSNRQKRSVTLLQHSLPRNQLLQHEVCVNWDWFMRAFSGIDSFKTVSFSLCRRRYPPCPYPPLYRIRPSLLHASLPASPPPLCPPSPHHTFVAFHVLHVLKSPTSSYLLPFTGDAVASLFASARDQAIAHAQQRNAFFAEATDA